MIIDSILNDKVGLGKSQLFTFFFLSLIDLNDGAQLILSSFLTPVIQTEFNLSQNEASNLASIFYLGGFVGSITSGKMADKYGRKPIILIGSLLQILVCTSFFWVNSYFTILMARGFYGFSFGFTIAITTTVFAQITPSKYRGKGILFLNFCVSIGKLYGLILAYIYLDSFTSGNWRAMMVLSCLPNIVVLIGSLIKLNQTPRFLIASKKFEEAYKVLEKMAEENNPHKNFKQYSLSESQKQEIKAYYQISFEAKGKGDFKSLFNAYYFKTTICLSAAWFSINFIYFGQLVALPFIFGKTNKSFGSYALTVLGEAPSFFVSILLVDRPNFGRKNSLKYFFSLSGITHILFAFSSLTIFSSISRFFMKMCFQMLYPCTTQLYGTLNRSLGFGFNSAIGRLGSTVMPFVILPLINQNITFVPVTFALFSFIGAFASYQLPRQPMERALDQKTQTNLSEQDEDNCQKKSIKMKMLSK